MPDSGYQTLVTVTPAGGASLLFPGGVQMNEEIGTGEAAEGLTWIDTTNTVHEEISAALVGFFHYLTMSCGSSAGGNAQIDLQTEENGSPAGSSIVSAIAIDRAGGDAGVAIIDSSGRSGFVRVPPGLNENLQCYSGIATLTWPGGTQYATQLAVPISGAPGNSSVIVISTYQSGVVCTVQAVAQTATSFTLLATAEGVNPAAGTHVLVNWIALCT